MWIARDSNGHLWGFAIKPMRFPTVSPVGWDQPGGQAVLLFDGLFPELTWEDEPIEVSIVRKHSLKKKKGA